MALSLLIVDDSRMIRTMTRNALLDMFAGRPIEISEAANGKQAIDAIETKRFEAILLDLTMPEMDGYDFLKQLGTLGSSAKVIVMSADVQSGAVQRALDLGAFAFLRKPVLASELAKALKKCGLL